MGTTDEKYFEIDWPEIVAGRCFLIITSAVTGKIDVRGLA
jgi:hypothetical protein